MKTSIKVLVIDDSALVRQTLTSIINSDPRLQVIGTAADPYFAARKIRDTIPDVITLDIEMPRMDGLTFLKTLMAQFPLPVVVISSLTQHGSELALHALDLGAVEVVSKSAIRNTKEHLEDSRILITDAIKAASMVTVNRSAPNKALPQQHTPVTKPDLPNVRAAIFKTTDKLIAIGASTGGTEALRYFLKSTPPNCPAILIVQHMPAGFTRSFSEHTNTLCEVTVKEATHGEQIMRGHAYISPGDRHMMLVRSGAKYFIKLTDGALVNRHKPAVDVLFESVAANAGQNAVGVIMTGMGRDGAAGLLKMKQAGAKTVAQDEQSCVVFGMPREAIKLGAADHVLSLKDIPAYVISLF